MLKLRKRVASFLREEDGVSTTEYAVMIAVILLAIVKAAQVLGVDMRETFQFVADVLN